MVGLSSKALAFIGRMASSVLPGAIVTGYNPESFEHDHVSIGFQMSVSPPDPDHHGRITVKDNVYQEKFIISIIDEGCGIRDENKFKIFEPFFTNKKCKSQSIGLGLSLSISLIETVGGEITFESEVGKGSIFNIALPLNDNM